MSGVGNMSPERIKACEDFVGLTAQQKMICNLAVNLKTAVDNQMMAPAAYAVLVLNVKAVASSSPEPEPDEQIMGAYMQLFFKFMHEEANEARLKQMPTPETTQ
jgi:hypothetical protein